MEIKKITLEPLLISLTKNENALFLFSRSAFSRYKYQSKLPSVDLNVGQVSPWNTALKERAKMPTIHAISERVKKKWKYQA